MEAEKKNPEIIIDASKAVLGRLASIAAKHALLGNDVIIVNAEKAVILGNQVDIFSSYTSKRQRGGSSQKGPNIPSSPSMLLKRTIRGMLSHRKGRGHDALKRVKCYEGTPEPYAGKAAPFTQSSSLKSVTLEQVSQRIGRNKL